MGCGRSVFVADGQAQESSGQERKQGVPDGAAPRESNTNPDLNGQPHAQRVDVGVRSELPVSANVAIEPGESLRVWICFKDTGKRTIFGLHEGDIIANPTCEGFARLLMSPAHKGRLRQLGFSGHELCILTSEGLLRRRSSTVTLDDLRACQD
eukprot:1476275-Rhodomonas_salina.3